MDTIKTERLVLRPMCEDYLDSTNEYASDPVTCRYMMFLPHESREETMEFLTDSVNEFAKEDPSFYEMAVFYEGNHVGAVSLYLTEDRKTAEFGWIINKKYHGLGIAPEAAKGLLKYASEHLGIKHFVAHCDTANEPSMKVMDKLGMTRVKESGGRFNRGSSEERREYKYEIWV